MYRTYGMSILQEQQIDDVQDVRYVDFAGATNRRRCYRGKSAFLEAPYTDQDIFAV